MGAGNGNGRARKLDTGVLYCDDNLSRLARLPSESVDLIYLDPPFFSNRVYEVIWGDEAEVRSFEDRWDGGMQHYVGWMRERVVELRRVLKQSGSLYLHCDPHASHYLKTMLDEVFGMGAFRSEVIWKRTSAHSSAKRWGPIHDVLLYYAAGNPTWNAPRTGYTDEYLNKYYRFDDGDGRLYWRADLCAAGVRNGESGKPWRGFDVTAKGMHWKFTVGRLDELDAEGRIYWAKGGTGWPQYKRYREELKGKAVGDIWDDIDRINPVGRERLGYPTQKPEALLRRIIEASSNSGDVVLDPFCGCGTTVTVAERLQRRWIGIDISPTAVNLMRRRLLKDTNGNCQPSVEGMPTTVDALRALKPFEFQNWVIAKVWGTSAPRKSGDMGIDGYSFMVHEPIQVKQSEKVGRNVVDNFETAMRRAGKTTGYIIAFSFTKDAKEEVARAKWHDKLDIRLHSVQSLLASTDERGPLIPQGATVLDMPLSPPTPVKELPSVEELIASDTA